MRIMDANVKVNGSVNDVCVFKGVEELLAENERRKEEGRSQEEEARSQKEEGRRQRGDDFRGEHSAKPHVEPPYMAARGEEAACGVAGAPKCVPTKVGWTAERERCREDFVYWAQRCVRIKDKRSGRMVPFVLNRPQRRVAALLERERRAGRPVRMIMLKARQWGGSTLVQMYMAWIQCTRMRNWHSLIVAQVGRTAATIRGMYDRMLRSYPAELWEERSEKEEVRNQKGDEKTKDEKTKEVRNQKSEGVALGEAARRAAIYGGSGNGSLRTLGALGALGTLDDGGDCTTACAVAPHGVKKGLVRWQGQEGIREIAGRGCRVTIGSAESQDSVRGADYAMAHLSEVAFWKDTPKGSPEDVIRAVCGSVALEPETLVVLESTANGVGNFFHTEWLRAERGESDKLAVFVPWYEIEIYSMELAEGEAWGLWESLDEYERGLWRRGLTLEQIKWYKQKRREYGEHAAMMAEYPTTPSEAFANTGLNVFSREGLERLMKGCRKPLAVGEVVALSGAPTGREALRGVRFTPDSTGGMEVWEHPLPGVAYVVGVDVGGRTARADWSVIVVMTADERPRVVAQWRGHIDHDLLTWKGAAVARHYNGALLVFESNSLEHGGGGSPTQWDGGTDCGAFMLHELYDEYENLYFRRAPGGGKGKPGFHTNRATKQMVVTRMIAAVRDGVLAERDAGAVEEMAVYQRLPNGGYGARAGFHDDRVMARAIALQAVAEMREGLRGGSLERDADLREFIRGV